MNRVRRALQRRIAVKLTLTLVGFVAVILAAASLYLNRKLESFAAESLEARLTTAGRLLGSDARRLLSTRAGADEVRAFTVEAARPSGARITVIAPDGVVLGDSDVPARDLPSLENHATRPEVRAALAGRTGHDVRRSATVDAPLFYVALPVVDAGRVIGVLRLALPVPVVTASYARLHRVMMLGGLLALGLATILALVLSGWITRPVIQMQHVAQRMSEGDFAARAPAYSSDEIGALGRTLNIMSLRLREKIDDLQQERTKLGGVLDGMVEGVIAIDDDDHIVLMNGPARAMFDLPGAPVEGKPVLEVVRHTDLHRIFREVRRHRAPALLRELRTGTSGERLLQANAVPLDFGGRDSGIVAVLHDVTELRRLESVRTEFVANVSHELRTPLTAIQGYVETLLGGALTDPENGPKFLEVVHRHTERLGRLLNDLTDLSNIELGRIVLRRSPIAVAEVVESARAIMQPRADQAGVSLATDVSPDVPLVFADHDRLHQILINLVDNAVKYTPRNGHVRVHVKRVTTAMVEIAVIDSGVGIPAADLPRITERFYRVDKARSRDLGGTGLGLAIVKHLVMAHGGELKLESEVDHGTTIRVWLPVADGATHT
jgi:two-component system phosphate regulon sensor histidine kinase PhoR